MRRHVSFEPHNSSRRTSIVPACISNTAMSFPSVEEDESDDENDKRRDALEAPTAAEDPAELDSLATAAASSNVIAGIPMSEWLK